jgi:hypothetical protein
LGQGSEQGGPVVADVEVALDVAAQLCADAEVASNSLIMRSMPMLPEAATAAPVAAGPLMACSR